MFKISIIIPVYNAEKYLKKCVDSIQISKFDDVQLILINDGSKDKSDGICKLYADLYPKQVVYISKDNAGVSAARNDGINVAEGEYIVFIDSDDFVSEDYVDQLHNMVKCPADLYVYKYQNVTQDGILVKNHHNKSDKTQRIVELNGEFCENIFEELEYQVWNKVFRNNIIQEYLIRFDKTMKWSEDLEFWLKYSDYVNEICISNQKLYYYRLNNDGAVASADKRAIADHHKAFQRQLQLFREKNATEYAYRVLIQAYVEHQGLAILQCLKRNETYRNLKKILELNNIPDDLCYKPISLSGKFKKICLKYSWILALDIYFRIINKLK